MRAVLLVAAVSLTLLGSGTVAAAEPAAVPHSEPKPRIEGIVKHAVTGEPIETALVVLNCTCIDASREAWTDERGIYRFVGPLPSGNYTIEVLSGFAHASKIFVLPREGKMRVNHMINPNDPVPSVSVVSVMPDPARDFSAVVNLAAGCRCGRKTDSAFALGRSLFIFDDGIIQRITGGPWVTRSLL